MAKKMNPFAADFEGLNKSADNKVFAMLKQAEKTTSEVSEQPTALTSETSNDAKLVKKAVKNEPQSMINKTKRKRETEPKEPVEWGKPVSHFNTRIPEKMSELLDDLVYKLRKKGKHRTKQDLAFEALTDLLKKHRVIDPKRSTTKSENSSVTQA